ncbi:MAG: CAP domain-containing protein [Flavobacteriales bacterium]
MKFKGFIVLCVLPILFSFSKWRETHIDINNLDQDKLENLIISKVNKLREKRRKTALTRNHILGLAASNQAEFLKKNKKLSHTQRSRKSKTPMDRTDLYGGRFSYVGENIAYTYLYEPVKGAANEERTVVLRSYEETAEYFYQLWKNSKTHYKNMIDGDFALTRIRFSFDSKTKRIYGVQVFGAL